MARFGFLSFAPFVLVLAGGCDNPPAMPDAPLADAPAIEPSFLFGPCVVDAECEHLGDGAICRPPQEGFTGGYCTLPCTDRTPCDAFGSYHHCLPDRDGTGSHCVPRCRNGIDCARDTWSCESDGGPTGDDGVCVSVCANDADCGGGAVCNVESGNCQAPPVDTSRAPHGSPCAAPEECVSELCALEGTAAQPSGWVGGMCIGRCRLPFGFNTDTYFDGGTLPQANCVPGAVCIAETQYGEGDLGFCYDDCESAADCREGYQCQTRFGDHTFSNGRCIPVDCLRGGVCPSGYRCATVTFTSGATAGRCTR